MTERELLYVIAIAEERNITHAAEKLCVAQPSLTQSLKRIEAELGCPLFVRRKYGLDPTPEGLIYLDMARDVICRLESFREYLHKQLNPLSGQVTIGASWYHTLLFLSELVSQFNLAYPSMQLQLLEKSTNELMTILTDGKLDFALAHEYPREYSAGRHVFSKEIEKKTLIDERFVLVAHRSFSVPVSDDGFAEVGKLSDMPFISFNANQRIRNITDFAFGSAGVKTRKIVFTQSFPGALDFAERGVGLTVLPEHYVHRSISSKPDIRCYPLPPQIHAYWSSSVYYRAGSLPPGVQENIISLLQDAASSLRTE